MLRVAFVLRSTEVMPVFFDLFHYLPLADLSIPKDFDDRPLAFGLWPLAFGLDDFLLLALADLSISRRRKFLLGYCARLFDIYLFLACFLFTALVLDLICICLCIWLSQGFGLSDSWPLVSCSGLRPFDFGLLWPLAFDFVLWCFGLLLPLAFGFVLWPRAFGSCSGALAFSGLWFRALASCLYAFASAPLADLSMQVYF